MRLALTLGTLSAAALLLAFIQQWYVFVIVGPGMQTDAFFAGMAIPQLILALVSGSLVNVVVPLLSGEAKDKARADAWMLLLTTTAFFTVASFLLIVTASAWAPLIFPGFSSAGTDLLIRLVRIQLLGMVATSASGILVAWCQSQRKFIRAEGMQLTASLLTLGFLIWALPRFGIAAAAWLTAARAAIVAALLLPSLGWAAGFTWSAAFLRQAWQRVRPLLAGTIYYKTDPVVDRYLASMSPPGQLSLLHLAQQIFNAASQIVNSGLAAPVIPVLAEHAKRARWTEFTQSVRRRAGAILAITIAGYLVLLLAGRPLLALLIGHGGVTQENVHFLWILLLALGGVLMAGSTGSVTAGAFYAMGDTRTPTMLGVITYTLYVPLKVIAYLRWGVVALAIATSAFTILNVGLQYFLLERGRARSARIVHETI